MSNNIETWSWINSTQYIDVQKFGVLNIYLTFQTLSLIPPHIYNEIQQQILFHNHQVFW